MRYLSSVYLVNQPLYVSGMFVARNIQGLIESYCIYTAVGVQYVLCSELTACWSGCIDMQGQRNVTFAKQFVASALFKTKSLRAVLQGWQRCPAPSGWRITVGGC